MENFNLYFEIFAAAMGIAYVTLEVLQKRSMWVMLFITSICYGIVYFIEGLYAMMALQFYYIYMAISTFVIWGRSSRTGVGEDQSGTGIEIRKLKPRVALTSIGISSVAFIVLGFIFGLTDNPRPWVDSAAAVLSMLATYWLSKKYIEQWYVWLVCNAISIWLYISQGMWPTMILYIAYTIMSLTGIYLWRKKGVIISD
jgi:nicotinamide mononucleotide transporter